MRDRLNYAKVIFGNRPLTEEEKACEKGWAPMTKAKHGHVVVNLAVAPEIRLNNIQVGQADDEELFDTVILQAYTSARKKNIGMAGFYNASEGETMSVNAELLKRFFVNAKKQSIQEYRWVVEANGGYYWYQLRPEHSRTQELNGKIMLRCVNFGHPANVACNSFLLVEESALFSMAAFSMAQIDIGNGAHFEPCCWHGEKFSKEDLNKCLPTELFRNDRAAYMSHVNYLFAAKLGPKPPRMP